jgi:hypothetical protein
MKLISFSDISTYLHLNRAWQNPPRMHNPRSCVILKCTTGCRFGYRRRQARPSLSNDFLLPMQTNFADWKSAARRETISTAGKWLCMRGARLFFCWATRANGARVVMQYNRLAQLAATLNFRNRRDTHAKWDVTFGAEMQICWLTQQISQTHPPSPITYN